MQTPFDFPAQFAFLSAVVMSTLSLIVITHHLINRRESLRRLPSGDPERVPGLKKASDGIRKLNWLILFQLIFTFFLILRIFLSALLPISGLLWYDVILVALAVIIFGPWWIYIFISLWPRKRKANGSWIADSQTKRN